VAKKIMFCHRSISRFRQKDPPLEKTHLCFCGNVDLECKRLHSKCKDPPSKVEKVMGGGVFPVKGSDGARTSKNVSQNFDRQKKARFACVQCCMHL